MCGCSFQTCFSGLHVGHTVETEEALSGRAEANQERKGSFSSLLLLPDKMMALSSLQPDSQRRGGGGGTATGQKTGQHCITWYVPVQPHQAPPHAAAVTRGDDGQEGGRGQSRVQSECCYHCLKSRHVT